MIFIALPVSVCLPRWMDSPRTIYSSGESCVLSRRAPVPFVFAAGMLPNMY